jgi:Tfp pilus assembly protein PilF
MRQGLGVLRLLAVVTVVGPAAAQTQGAAKDSPGRAAFVQCATLYNHGDMDGALAACNQAIAADPKIADAYFVKGSALFGQGTLSGAKVAAPPGTHEALDQYLALAPDGAHASDVKQMLDAMQ